MGIPNSSIVWRLAAWVLLAALLLAPAAGAVSAQDATDDDLDSQPIVYMAVLRDVNDPPEALNQVGPDLEQPSFQTPLATLPLTPGASETITISAQPIQSSSEHADSFYQYGPNNWTVSSISNAPVNNRGNGLGVGQSYQGPNTGGNTTAKAHAYWGYVPSGGNPFNYVNAATIAPPDRSGWFFNTRGVYTAAASPGGPLVQVETDFVIPTSWSAYLCPGAKSGTTDEYIGMSGRNTDPNYMITTLRSSYTGWLVGGQDVSQIPILACRQPAVSVTKTGTVTGITGDPGGPGTVTVQYCFTVTNATTPGSGVHLASYQVSDTSIGYNSGTVSQALAPGDSDQICTSYTHNVTWPATGNVCVTNSSGASATGTTPLGWGEITPGDPGSGFTTRAFTSPAATGGVGLVTCASPMAVALADFSAAQVGDHVLVTWETVSELDIRGFNLYRGTSADGPDVQLNDALIPAQSQGSPEGFTYTYEDRRDLVSGTTYWYWLEDLDTSGALTRHEPVAIEYRGAPSAVALSGYRASATTATLPALAGLGLVALAGLALGVGRTRQG